MRNDVVLVHHAIEQGVEVEQLRGVRTFPTEVFRHACFANDAGSDGNATTRADFLHLRRYSFEITEAQAKVLLLLLPRLARKIAQVAGDFDGHSDDAALVAIAELRRGNQVGQQAFENEQAMANEMI